MDRTDEKTDAKKFSWDDHFFGAVTVGERGQVVIPSEARREFGIEPGDKLLIMRGPGKHGLVLGKLDEMREFMNSFREGLERVEEGFRGTSETTASGSAAAASAAAAEEKEIA